MNFEQKKNTLQEIGTNVNSLIPLLPAASVRVELEEWRRDIESDFFSVVLVGVFNRGKSTLLNSLLDAHLLPVGITPTTAILTVLRYADRPCLFIHHKDGTVNEVSFSPETLQQFSADGGIGPSEIDYVEIGLGHSMLANGMLYVDTPGVSDLNREREDITYRFVPRADVVLFVLDATTPVTRSELDFLESTVLASQIKRLMFVLNFADRLEPHERDAGATLARRRVASVLGECDFPVFLVSAADGSGIPLLRDALTAIQSCGPQSDEKIQRLSGRLDGLIDALLADLSKADKAATLDDNALRQQYEELQARWKAREERIAKIADWTRERESELLAMVRKSLYTFVDGLREDVEDDVSSYNGPDFKGFVETQIPLLIKKRCKNWIESHSDAMRQLLKRLSDSLTEALNNEFATRISPLQPQATRQLGSEYRYSDLKSADASDGRLKAGLLVGGAGALMFALGASMLYPLVTLAAYPLLSKELEKHGLRTAKQAFLPELHRALDNVSTHFTADVLVSLQTEIHGLQIAAEEKYRDLLQGEVRQVEHEQIGRQECVALVRNRRSELREVMGKLTEYKQRLARINESEEGAYE